MTSLQTRLIRGLDELRLQADPWNSLWQRSDTHQPTVTAELIDLWCRSFAPDCDFQALVIESAGSFVAGLPLVSRRKMGIFPSFEFPTNCWSNAGDLVLDANCDQQAVCRALLRGLRQLDHPFVVFDEINLDSHRWSCFFEVLGEEQIECRISKSYTVGITHILHDWQRYEKSWSSNHRRGLKKSTRRLEAAGNVQAIRITEDSEDLEAKLNICFEIEDRGWKGKTGGSVVRLPGMLDFMIQEARLVASKGMLELWLLQLDDRIIAFNYCHSAKGTCFAHKISFDPEFSHFGPGRLLRRCQLEAMHQDPQARIFDSLGVMCQANASWSTASYTMGRLTAATGSAVSRHLLRAMKLTQPLVKRLKGSGATEMETPPVGASRYLESATDLHSIPASDSVGAHP